LKDFVTMEQHIENKSKVNTELMKALNGIQTEINIGITIIIGIIRLQSVGGSDEVCM
jgi:hypothetical protein